MSHLVRLGLRSNGTSEISIEALPSCNYSGVMGLPLAGPCVGLPQAMGQLFTTWAALANTVAIPIMEQLLPSSDWDKNYFNNPNTLAACLYNAGCH